MENNQIINDITIASWLWCSQQELAGAEQDFRQTLKEEGEDYRLDALYYLALTLYYRGKVRVSLCSRISWLTFLCVHKHGWHT